MIDLKQLAAVQQLAIAKSTLVWIASAPVLLDDIGDTELARKVRGLVEQAQALAKEYGLAVKEYK